MSKADQAKVGGDTVESITSVLQAVMEGHADANDKLLPLIYQELRIVARSQLSKHAHHDMLNTTALVHETYMKLLGQKSAKKLSNRRHFYATAALAMRQILVDQARRRLAEKRGSGQRAVTLDEGLLGDEGDLTDLIVLNSVLEQLQKLEPRLADVVQLRFFAGLSIQEIANLFDLSESTITRDWQKARAFLRAQLSD